MVIQNAHVDKLLQCALGRKRVTAAFDLETGRDLSVVDGAVKVRLPKFDYVMIGFR